MRILIVEDDRFLADSLVRTFQLIEEACRARIVDNLKDALAELEAHDGVLSDGSFPAIPLIESVGPWRAGLNWSQVALRARELGRPFVLFTGLPATVQTFNRVHGESEGNGPWLAAAFAKPLEGMKACQTLVDFIRQKAEAQQIPIPGPGYGGIQATA